jgi:DNA repair photolyase
MASPSRPAGLRWRLAADEPDALFPDETAVARRVGTGAYQGLEFLEVQSRSIVNTVPAESRVPFRHTINAYRGCTHACVYCFARPTHEYLGLGIGRDFETKIVVKVNAVERLEAELRAPTWNGEPIAMGTNTDPYQAAEGKYHLTQRIIDVLGEARNPFSILTKSTLVLRDLRRLEAAAARTEVRLDLSIGTLDRDVWRLTEPGAPPPEQRVAAVRRLNEAGIPCGVLVAPILPGLSDGDDQLKAVVEAVVEAGAVSVALVALHLRPGVREHFLSWLDGARPDLAVEYRRRFRRAYQPGQEIDGLRRRVRALAEAARPAPGEAERLGPRGFGHQLAARRKDAPGADDVARHPSAQGAPRQLRLL